VGGFGAYSSLYSDRFVGFIKALPRSAIASVYLSAATAIISLADSLPYLGTGPLSRLFVTAFFAFVILEQNFARSSLVKLGQFSLMSKLGTYTYGLYLLHPIVYIFVQKTAVVLFHPSFTSISTTCLTAAGTFVGTVVMSMVSFHYYEEPFLKLKRRLAHVESAH
jgi:peptidoglycan/LPS O-acetylase OafA/YrhL